MDPQNLLSAEDEIVQKLVTFPDKRWTFLMLRPRNEKKVAQEFSANNIIAYLPLRTKVEKHNRGKRETLLPMFPGYLFVCPDIQERLIIKKNPAVRYIKNLTECQETSLIRDLLKVRECELLSAGHKLEVNPGLKPGRKAVVKKGPFKGQEVIVHRRKNAFEVVVNLEFINQYLEMTFSADDLFEV